MDEVKAWVYVAALATLVVVVGIVSYTVYNIDFNHQLYQNNYCAQTLQGLSGPEYVKCK